MQTDKDKRYKIWFSINSMLSVGLLIIIAYCARNSSVWVDEIFSLKLANQTWNELFQLAKEDVHPPLYYIILKMGIALGKVFGLDSVFAGKLNSFIPYFLLIIFAGRKIAKKSGLLMASLFSLCMVGMPNMVNYAIEIRGYSWSLFFVTMAFLEAGEIRDGEEKGTKVWMRLWIFGILAAYTHYFACVAIAVIYMGLLIRRKRDKLIVQNCIYNILFSCIAYIPWIFVFLSQYGSVLKDYWIGNITRKEIYGYFRFLFAPPVGKMHADMIVGGGLAVVYAILFVNVLRDRKKWGWELWGCAVLLLTVMIGVVISFLGRPIFVARYMIVAAGCFWLCYAYLICQNRKKKKLMAVAVIITLLVSMIDIGQFVRWEGIRKQYFKDFTKVVNEVNENDEVITDGEHMQGCLSWYLGKEATYILTEDVENYIEHRLRSTGRIWYFSMGAVPQLENMLDKRYRVEHLGEHHFEYYTFYVLKIEWMK